MPHSDPVFDQLAEVLVTALQPQTALDIGCGEGKYGRLVSRVTPSCRTTGIEIDADYIARFNLRSVYHEVRQASCMDLFEDPEQEWDLVTIGDTIEHLRKSDGIDLLNFLLYRSKVIFVAFPVAFRQNSWEGRKQEAHISSWGEIDFAGMCSFCIPAGGHRAVIIDGFIEHPPMSDIFRESLKA